VRIIRTIARAAVLSLLGGTLLLPRVSAQDDTAARARELAAARADVERLEAEIRAARDRERRAMGTLAAQRDEIAVLLRRERIRVDELRSRLADLEAARAQASVGGGDLRSTVLAAADGLIEVVSGGLPFRLDDRLGALGAVRDDVAGGRLSSENATSRLWQFIEDEIRLAGDIGRYRDVVELDGRRELVEIAKLGMLALYVRTTDGRIAHAVEREDGFVFEPLEAPGDVRAVQRLFDALGRRVLGGEHELPLERDLEDVR
jgi:hypothetical protein